jgi:dienelactone hydrolase
MQLQWLKMTCSANELPIPGLTGPEGLCGKAEKKEGKYSTVIVIHENRGSNARIEAVAKRAAKAGYPAITPNALSSPGGTPPNEDHAPEIVPAIKAGRKPAEFYKGI